MKDECSWSGPFSRRRHVGFFFPDRNAFRHGKKSRVRSAIELAMMRSIQTIAALSALALLASRAGAAERGGETAPERTGPRVAVAETKHDFGAIDVGSAGRHAFVFTNSGDQPLVLTAGRSTCGCCTCVCAVRLPESPIGLGDSAEVTLEWRSSLYVGPFRQSATIRTNDADRPEVVLRIAGRFKGPVGMVPSMLRFSRVPLGRSATAEVRLHNYLDELLEIVGCACSDPSTAEHFDVAWERLPAERAKEAEARGGYLLRVTVKPGMPRGAFRQRIVLTTSAESVPKVELPVEGSVAADVSVYGGGWIAHTGVLSIGRVKRDRRAERTLLVVARGPHARRFELQPAQVVPKFLTVELGETSYSETAAISQTRLVVRIPPGAPPAAHLGDGRGELGHITLKTNHPAAPELEIRVRFSVEE